MNYFLFKYDSGAPLYMSSTELIGIADTLALDEGEISIFSLLGNKKGEIEKFIDPPERYSE